MNPENPRRTQPPAKRIWQDNVTWWAEKKLPLKQELIFASTGTKDPKESPDRYVSALAGSDIQTNPPGTNAAVQNLTGATYSRTIDKFPPADVVAEIDREVDFAKLEETLMFEGLAKFADPHKALIKLIADKRKSL